MLTQNPMNPIRGWVHHPASSSTSTDSGGAPATEENDSDEPRKGGFVNGPEDIFLGETAQDDAGEPVPRKVGHIIRGPADIIL